MTEDERAVEFSQFVAGLPPAVETDLISNAAVSTAYFAARSAGWTTEQLVGDAHFALRGGRSVGNIVTRLRGLAEARPVDRSAVGTITRMHRRRFTAVTGEWCPCGATPAHRIPPALSTEHTAERSDLLDLVAASNPHPDEAERMMRDLIDSQRPPEPEARSW